MPRVDHPGIYRAQPISYGVQESKKGKSVAVVIRYQIVESYDPDKKEWLDWRECEAHTIDGYHYVVKSDGEINDTTVEQLIRATGWSGKFSDFNDDSLKLKACQITVADEEYEGKHTLKINWVNPWDFTPGLQNRIDKDGLAALDNKYGSKMRAKAGNLARNVPPNAAAKPGPKPMSSPPTMDEYADAQAAANANVDTSFP